MAMPKHEKANVLYVTLNDTMMFHTWNSFFIWKSYAMDDGSVDDGISVVPSFNIDSRSKNKQKKMCEEDERNKPNSGKNESKDFWTQRSECNSVNTCLIKSAL